MNDAALKFEVPVKFCGLKSRFHFTPKLGSGQKV